MIDEFLVSFLNADATLTSLADEIAVGEVPVDTEGNLLAESYIWISNFDESDHLDLDGDAGLTRYRFDIECCSTSIRTAKQMARQLKTLLQGYGPGTFGTVTPEVGPTVLGQVEAVFVESKDENYRPVNQFTNIEMAVIAQDIEIVADDVYDDTIGAA